MCVCVCVCVCVCRLGRSGVEIINLTDPGCVSVRVRETERESDRERESARERERTKARERVRARGSMCVSVSFQRQ